ncbi:ApeA N-terminal domain 1-containing protein [Glutamicibacter sp. X7]
MNKEPVAHKLPFEYGEFLCTWFVKDKGGERVELSGLLSLELGRYPHGTLYGDLPLESSNGAYAFPQQYEFDVLYGRLANGGSVALMNGWVEYHFLGQGTVRGAFAVLSRNNLSSAEARKYGSITVQMDGLDAVFGIAPIQRTSFPRDLEENRTWSAELNKESVMTWESDLMCMKLGFSYSITSGDPYEFRIVSGAVLTLSSDKAMRAEDWWTTWVSPLRRLMSLIIKDTSNVHSFLAAQSADHAGAAKDQVFGLGITQNPQNSNTRRVRALQPALDLTEDNCSLLSLLENWKQQVDARHPLLETFGTMLTISEEHPRSRVLLYLQALEGLFGYETEAERQAREVQYTEKRTRVLERVEQSTIEFFDQSQIEKSDFRFIKKNLQKRPMSGLQDALRRILDSLSIDLRPDLIATEIAQQIHTTQGDSGEIIIESVLVKLRNDLSHGSASYDPRDLEELANILDRIARSETLRVVGAPSAALSRALK